MGDCQFGKPGNALKVSSIVCSRNIVKNTAEIK